jgi:charged multivesicular body protein 3
MFVFGGKKLTPKEQQRKWKKDLRAQQRALDKQIRENQRHEKKVQAEIKKYAKSGDTKIVKTLAKDIVKSRKSTERLYTGKAQINSVSMQLQSQFAMSKVTEAMGKSTSIMKSMQALVSLPQVADLARNLAREMEKSGMIEEMQEDMMEMLDPEDMDEEIEEEVDKVITELTMGRLAGAGSAPVGSVAAKKAAEEAADVKQMEDRLAALSS